MKHVIALLLALSPCAGCPFHLTGSRDRSSADVGQIRDEQSLIDYLKKAGADVRPDKAFKQNFLSVEGKYYAVNREFIHVTEYPTPQALEADTVRIAPEGNLSSNPDSLTLIIWPDDPHLFRQGRVLVLYAGQNQAIQELLQGALGPQFAGY